MDLPGFLKAAMLLVVCVESGRSLRRIEVHGVGFGAGGKSFSCVEVPQGTQSRSGAGVRCASALFLYFFGGSRGARLVAGPTYWLGGTVTFLECADLDRFAIADGKKG
jgi:hypothetical protein